MPAIQNQSNNGQPQGVDPTDEHYGQPRMFDPTDKRPGQPHGVDPTEEHRGQPQGGDPTDEQHGQPQGVDPTDEQHGQPQGVESTEERPGQTQEVDLTQEQLSLPEIVHRIKSLSTHQYLLGVRDKGWLRFEKRLWQRSYYEHIIRNEKDYQEIYDYIAANPMSWEKDGEFSF